MQTSDILNRLYAYFQVDSSAKLAEKLGVLPSTISNWKKRNSIDWELIFTKCKDADLNWLVLGYEKKQGGSFCEMVAEPLSVFWGERDGKRTQRVPLYRIEAAAGIVSVFETLQKQTPVDYLSIPNLPKCDGAVYVTGDSMYPLLKSGDIIVYKVLHDISNIFWGEMYLLSIVHNGDSYITVKYVQKSEQEGFVKLVSQNQHHQEKELPIDSIRFAALVKASVRINSMG
jgi:hypothetical protein